ncbi:MAG: DUF302 domain-containing protein [Roseateles sp.]|uniref:DUF302 domain-containing protein n=1 Tax=Roseateles sp. TaxID=1971397 RepID=UPI0040352BC5
MKRVLSAPPVDLLKAEAYIKGESTLAVVCDAPFDDVAARLEGSILANDMLIVHMHDIGKLLQGKGIGLGLRCRIYEVFNAHLAAQLIQLDAGLAHVLPCRISLHDQGGLTTVTTPMPSALITEFSHSADVARVARIFEAGLQRVLQGLR